MLGLTRQTSGTPSTSLLLTGDQLGTGGTGPAGVFSGCAAAGVASLGGSDGGSGFPDDPAAAGTTVAAVFPPGWAPREDALTEDERWELAHDDGHDLTPAQLDALMAKLPPGLLDDPELDGETSDPPGTALLGLMPRDIAVGGGFDAGGVADQLPPGLVLAALAHDTWQAGMWRLNDDELVGLALAWRRLHSWATAGELAAIAELDRRRTREAGTVGDPGVADHLGDELAMAMTLTGRSADALLDFARDLTRLPGTRDALAAGLIDRAKAYVLATELSVLDGPLAAKVERVVLDRAPQQTTSQLRAATKRAVLAVDPAAARKRQEAAQRNARVEVWHEPSGTASLAGRDLPPAEVLAADQRITALARRLKATGREGTLDELRARVYTGLLLGHSVDDLIRSASPVPEPAADRAGGSPASHGHRPPADTDGHKPPADTDGHRPPADIASNGGSAAPAGNSPAGTAADPNAHTDQSDPAASAGLRGSVNLTLPLATWLGTSDGPGELAGLGPILADDARALAQALAVRPGNRWCLTLTGPNGQAVAHGCTTVAANRRTSGTSRATSTSTSTSTSTAADGRTSRTSGTSKASNTSASINTSKISSARRRGTSGDSRDDTRRSTGSTGPPGALTITLTPLATHTCSHQRETPGYHPTAGLRHALHVRQRTCSAPGCRRDATGCDLDHTVPYAQGGRTCECGLAPLCRRHHRAKQTYGWRLEQPQPGVLVWRLPHGRTYRVEPEPYLD